MNEEEKKSSFDDIEAMLAASLLGARKPASEPEPVNS
jgi:hypothetical protein